MSELDFDPIELKKEIEKLNDLIELKDQTIEVLKNTRHYENKKLDLYSLYVPFYRITQLRTPVALIITPGKQIIIKKLPKKKEYFFDKELGIFQIKPDYAFFIGKTATYLYDYRNQNPIDPGLLNELWKWANFQHIYKIRRSDIDHAKRLRSKKHSNLVEEIAKEKRELRKYGNEIIASVDTKNQEIEAQKKQEAGTDDDKEEYRKFSEDDKSFIIVKNMFQNGYITAEQATILNHKLTTKKIRAVDDLLRELESFCDVYVSKPIPVEVERVLEDYHTYNPQSVVPIINQLAKIYKGMKNLRTKPIINWFPATYLLFGALGIGIVIMLWLNYGGQVNLMGTPP